MLEVLFLFPLCAGLLTLLLPSRTVRRGLLLLVAVTHLALSLLTLLAVGRGQTPSAFFGLLEPDAVGVLFLALASTLFCAAHLDLIRQCLHGCHCRLFPLLFCSPLFGS